MSVVLLGTDLMMGSRVHAAADVAGVELVAVASPDALPVAGGARLLLVDWAARTDAWGQAIASWRDRHAAKVVLYGPHVDLEAHAAARAANLGPMWARSRLIGELPALMAAAVA